MNREPETLMRAPAPNPSTPEPDLKTLTILQALEVVLEELAADLDRWEVAIPWEALEAATDLGVESSLELLGRPLEALVDELGALAAAAAQDNPGV